MEADRKAAKKQINARKAAEIASHTAEDMVQKDTVAQKQWEETEKNGGEYKPMELSDAEKAEIQKYNEKEAADKALEKKQEEEENYQKYKAQRAQKEKEAKAKKAEKVEPKVKTDSEIA